MAFYYNFAYALSSEQRAHKNDELVLRIHAWTDFDSSIFMLTIQLVLLLSFRLMYKCFGIYSSVLVPSNAVMASM